MEIGQILGSFEGKFAVVGGAVPWLLLEAADMQHVGTIDIDLTLDAEALGDGDYVRLVEALMGHGYAQSGEHRRFQLVRTINMANGGRPSTSSLTSSCRAMLKSRRTSHLFCRNSRCSALQVRSSPCLSSTGGD